MGWALVCWLGATADCAAQSTLWYNGDWDLKTQMYNGYYGPVGTSQPYLDKTYADFNVPAPGWNISRIWSHNVTAGNSVHEAQWEIWNTTPSLAGTPLFSGSQAASFLPTGKIGTPNPYPEFTLLVNGMNLTLSPGHYWMSVVPVIDWGPGWNTTWCTAYFTRTQPSTIYRSYYNNYWTVDEQFSMGIAGTLVPEPSTLTLLGLGLAALAGMRARFAQKD